MTVLGIDGGLTGGWTMLDKDGAIMLYGGFPLVEIEKKNTRKGAKSKTRIERMYNLTEMALTFRALRKHNPIVFLEQVASMPRDGVVQAFKFGDCLGQIKGVLAAKGFLFHMVAPQTWTRVMNDYEQEGLSSKERSRRTFYKIWPNFHKVKDGIIDSALIAEYGRRLILSEEPMKAWTI